MMKIDDKVNFLCFLFNNFRNNKYPQKEENLNNSLFCGRIAQNFTETMPGLISDTLPMMVIISVIVCEIWQKLCLLHKSL